MSRAARSFLTLSLTLGLNVKTAVALPTALSKRSSGLTRGATAGLGIGIVVAVILCVVVVTILIIHFRAQARAAKLEQTRSIILNEKRTSAATTITNENATPRFNEDKNLAPQIVPATVTASPPTGLPRRSKSLKDRLMGPMYHGSDVDLSIQPPMPAYARRSRLMIPTTSGDGTPQRTDSELDLEFAQQRGQGNRSAVPSYSSRRVTRLMMMM